MVTVARETSVRKTRPPTAAAPTWIDPMKAVLVEHVPADKDGWGFEIKWDGFGFWRFRMGKNSA